MRKYDRMEWPKRYKIKSSVLLLAILGMVLGLIMHHKQNQALARNIVISDLSFSSWGSQFIELSYRIENKDTKPQKIKLLAEVWDSAGSELASSLFEIEIPRQSVQNRSKMLDRLQRSLKEGEIPGRANIRLYLRKAF